MSARTTPRCYFSFRSPYSWLAHQELSIRHRALAERMEWVPFFDPDPLTARLVAERGGHLPPGPARDDDRVWEVPHLAHLAAAEHGRGRDFLDAAFRARFLTGRDLCDRATVEAIGRGLGLPAGLLGRASDLPRLRARAIGGLLDALADGVFGVPFFAHGTTRCFGLDRVDAFAARVPAPAPARAPDPAPARAPAAGPARAPAAARGQPSDPHQPAVSAASRRSSP
ncbi:2-hydroxychromene-2-carboxylate isomerase [Streptomyces sp. G45]|uniref:2-hydroxychromene-2-carboxylate isomerase n=1 Tax=Streptomyces sp. G45 TaxID=3406627 RepID=UPI003C17DD1A